jgi:hypothetical protein
LLASFPDIVDLFSLWCSHDPQKRPSAKQVFEFLGKIDPNIPQNNTRLNLVPKRQPTLFALPEIILQAMLYASHHRHLKQMCTEALSHVRRAPSSTFISTHRSTELEAACITLYAIISVSGFSFKKNYQPNFFWFVECLMRRCCLRWFFSSTFI